MTLFLSLRRAGLNIGAHQEAIEHFLGALALQESSGGGKSEQLWTTLRRAFQAMVSVAHVPRPDSAMLIDDDRRRTVRTSRKWRGPRRSWMCSASMALTFEWGLDELDEDEDRSDSQSEGRGRKTVAVLKSNVPFCAMYPVF